ncbi:thermonuclease family protein [Hyphomonas sp.]|uniref:thermonuclease family protein n=1 Tax=Hyphomonas sp. TaxID=87 RepID=UPI0032EDC72A
MRHKHTATFSMILLLAACGQMNGDAGRAVLAGDQSDRIAGVASVIDGDTIEIHGQRIRLSGFDSPERGKTCAGTNVYQKAALFLSDQIGSRTVTCTSTGKDSYERAVATCSVNGADLGDLMVGAGWARDWPKYSQGAYADSEMRARAARKGVWNLDCPNDLWGNRKYD